MIGYRITHKALAALIDVQDANWRKNAAERTKAFRKAGEFNEQNSIWSKIKPVYLELQGESKCGFCERKLESVDYGLGEQAIEHFRPKRQVVRWGAPKQLTDAGIVFADVPSGTSGYYLLAYHLFNYCASCIPCNSAIKANYFPTLNKHAPAGSDPKSLLTREKPYLIYPIGDFDNSPEKLIRFEGVSPQAIPASGHGRHRALVTIEFFKLDDAIGRRNLYRERAVVILALFPQLERRAASTVSATAKKNADRIVAGFTSSKSPHANCARCFVKLYGRDPVRAAAMFDEASNFVASIS